MATRFNRNPYNQIFIKWHEIAPEISTTLILTIGVKILLLISNINNIINI